MTRLHMAATAANPGGVCQAHFDMRSKNGQMLRVCRESAQASCDLGDRCRSFRSTFAGARSLRVQHKLSWGEPPVGPIGEMPDESANDASVMLYALKPCESGITSLMVCLMELIIAASAVAQTTVSSAGFQRQASRT